MSIAHVSFSPVSPYTVAVATSAKVLIFDKNCQVKKRVTRFKSAVCCSNFRGDGKLLVAGTQQGILSVHDISSRIILRTFRDHIGAVRQAHFSHADFAKICSSGDDKTVRLFDTPTGKQVKLVGEHTDYVRALCQHPTDASTWISGSYDHSVKFWDTRTDSKEATRSFDHGHPVESVLAMPMGTLVLTAGDNKVKVWDVMSGRMVTSFSNHQKVVTTLASSNNGTRILSGSADGMVKVYDSTSFQVTHSWTYDSPVLSCDISADNTAVCVGLADGTVSIRARPARIAAVAAAPRRIRTGSRRFFERGAREKAGENDYKTELFKKQALKPYDKFLKKFQYHHALDAALQSERAVVVASVCDELRIRGGLQIALSGRDEDSLPVFLRFLLKNLLNPHYTELLTHVAHLTLDLYSSVIGQSMVIDEMLVQLRTRLRDETQLQKDMFALMGALDVVVSSATRRSVPVSHTPSASKTVSAKVTDKAGSVTESQTDTDSNADQPITPDSVVGVVGQQVAQTTSKNGTSTRHKKKDSKRSKKKSKKQSKKRKQASS